MALSWLGAVRTKYDKVKAYIRAQEAEAQMSWEYIDRAPGWLHLDTSYSLFPPPGYELNPAVERFIKSWCPDYIPCWETKVYLPPYDDAAVKPEIFVRHCISRHVLDPKITLHTFPKLTAPAGFKGKLPNYLEMVITAGDDPRASDLPGLYAPLDMTRAEQLRKVYDKFKELKPSDYAHESVMVPFNAVAFANAKAAEKRRAAERYITKRLTNHLKTVSDPEALNLICGEQDEIRKGYAFLKSGTLPSPYPMAGPQGPPKEQ